MKNAITEYPGFFTATNLERKRLLAPDKYKNIIVNSLCFLVRDNRIILNAFVVMPTHIHLIWQMKAGKKVNEVQRDFLKFTAQRIKADLSKNHPQVLAGFKVDATDREYQFWERNPLSIELRTEQYMSKSSIIFTGIRLEPDFANCRKIISIPLQGFMKSV